ncbi:hypothetical protein MRB53_037438 [Persea americana]|nr:hypothetical protein MRB53_037438 [Persea americana]
MKCDFRKQKAIRLVGDDSSRRLLFFVKDAIADLGYEQGEKAVGHFDPDGIRGQEYQVDTDASRAESCSDHRWTAFMLLGVKVVFGIPGAKVDAIFDTLSDHPEIKLVVCRHEQNAAFMAAACGRITGPGAGNLTTGLITATPEGDPVVAIVGSVPRAMSTKHTHQSMPDIAILSPGTKSAIPVAVEDQASEILLQAFRTATTSPKGAAVVSLPTDIAAGKSSIGAFPPSAYVAPKYGPAPSAALDEVARMIENAKLPVLFLGQRASSQIVVDAVRKFLAVHKLPVERHFKLLVQFQRI